MQHSENGYGENIHWSSGPVDTGKSPVKHWYSEYKDYDYGKDADYQVCNGLKLFNILFIIWSSFKYNFFFFKKTRSLEQAILRRWFGRIRKSWELQRPPEQRREELMSLLYTILQGNCDLRYLWSLTWYDISLFAYLQKLHGSTEAECDEASRKSNGLFGLWFWIEFDIHFHFSRWNSENSTSRHSVLVIIHISKILE